MKLLAFDAGGTEIKYGIVENGTTITDKGYFPTPTDCFESFLQKTSEVYSKYKDMVEGIAMTIPGPVDVENGTCHGNGAMKYKHDIEIARCLSERCGCKVVLDNDAKAAILAEHKYGSLKGCNNAAVFVIGTAVGGGFIINGDIVRGATFNAGEFSFVNTEADNYTDEDQILGNRCSTTSLLKSYQKKTGSDEMIDGREFFSRLPHDKAAQDALDELSMNIAIQLYNLYWLLDLERVAIGGGISQQAVLIKKIKEKYREVELNSYMGKHGATTPMEIVPCQFRNDANLIGAYITYEKQTAGS